jgi:uncharacterized protein YjgD (DUF1641 family)
MKTEDAKLNDINNALGALETELLQRKLAQREDDLEDAMDVINSLADQGVIDVCDPCE